MISPDNLIKKRKQEAEARKAFIQKLNSKQLSELKASIIRETILWKKNLIEKDWCNFGPKYKVDKFSLPTPQTGVQQPKWVHNRRKFLESLNFKERNILLTGDPYLEFDPCTYVLMYSYPRQVQQYPAIAQAFPHIVQPGSPTSSTASSSAFSGYSTFSSSPNFSSSQSSSSPNFSGFSSSSSAANSPQPSTSKGKSAKFFTVPKAITKVLRSREVKTTDQPRSTAWIRRTFSKKTNPSGNKAPP